MKEAVKCLYSIFPLPIIAIGTLGNILCIIVCRRKVVKEHAFSICLIVLAASDTVSMHSGLWRWWVKAAFDYDIRRSDLSCKMLLFLLWFSGDNSSWILCLITIQRFVSVWIPTKAKWLCNHKASIIGCASMALLTFAKNLHLLVADYKTGPEYMVNYSYVGGCEPASATYLHFLLNEWGILDLTLGAILPFSIIAICNSMIVVKLWKSGKTKNSGTENSREKKIGNINVMLTVNSVVFLILVMPWYLVVVITTYVRVDPSTLARLYDAYYLTLLLWFVNPAINFYLYCLGGPMFRRELIALCGFRSKTVGITNPPTSAPTGGNG